MKWKHARSLAAAGLAVALAVGPVGPAAGDPSDETHVDDLSASLSGGEVSVVGKARFVDGPVTLGEDPAGDAVVPDIGADLMKATVTARVGSGSGPSATLTVVTDEMLPRPQRDPLGYRWHLSLSAYATDWVCWLDASARGPRFRASSCGLGDDVSPAGTALSGTIEGGRVEWELPSAFIRPGESLTTSRVRAGTAVTDNNSTPSAFLLAFDEMTDVQQYEFPVPSVSLGIAPEGTPADEVPLTGTATVASNGSFEGSLPAEGLASGDYVVAVQACFGQGPCALSSTTVTI